MRYFSFLAIFCLTVSICWCDDLCERMKSDYLSLQTELKDFEKNPSENITLKLVFIESLYNNYKFEQAYNILKKENPKAVALRIILAKLYIYYDEYDKAMIELNDILNNYPKHLEAKHLRNAVNILIKLDKEIDLNKSELDNRLKKSSVFRDDLFFPDKSLDCLRTLLVNYPDEDIWFEIGKTYYYCYSFMMNDDLSENDIIVRAITQKMSKKTGWCITETNKYFIYALRIFSHLQKKIDLDDEAAWIKISFLSVNDEILEKIELNRLRKLISEIYVLKMDFKKEFYEIIKQTLDCSFKESTNFFRSSKYTTLKIKKNVLGKNELFANVYELFQMFQKNYQNVDNWNGPYLSLTNDSYYGCDYLYYENLQLNEMWLLSCECSGGNVVECNKENNVYSISINLSQ